MAGFYWHVHHDVIMEWCWDEQERRRFINFHKPAGEKELRQRLFKRVKGQLPVAVVRAGKACGKAWAACDKARAAYDKARAACDKAWAACYKARAAYGKAWAACDKARAACDKARAACDKARAACDKAGAAYDKAWAACDKAWAACDKARAAYGQTIRDNTPVIEALHAQECPGCPWDGETIFPGKEEA